MYQTLSYKAKQFLWLVLKVFIVILSMVFIYQKVSEIPKTQLEQISVFWTKKDLFWYKNTFFILILSLFNWFFEIKKWQTLAQKVASISLYTALQQSLASLTSSLLTPNRLGEYPAKAIYYHPKKRKEILALNAIGNGYQLLVTLLFGIVGVFGIQAWRILPLEIPSKNTLWILVLGILGLLLFGYRFRISLQKVRRNVLNYLNTVPTLIHKKVALYSVLRYLIFSHQCYYILVLLGVHIGYTNTIAAIFSIYLIASVVPFLSALDILLKGSVAVLVLALFSVPPVLALSTMTVMWVLNFMLPAIFGMYFVSTFTPKQCT